MTPTINDQSLTIQGPTKLHLRRHRLRFRHLRSSLHPLLHPPTPQLARLRPARQTRRRETCPAATRPQAPRLDPSNSRCEGARVGGKDWTRCRCLPALSADVAEYLPRPICVRMRHLDTSQCSRRQCFLRAMGQYCDADEVHAAVHFRPKILGFRNLLVSVPGNGVRVLVVEL